MLRVRDMPVDGKDTSEYISILFINNHTTYQKYYYDYQNKYNTLLTLLTTQNDIVYSEQKKESKAVYKGLSK